MASRSSREKLLDIKRKTTTSEKPSEISIRNQFIGKGKPVIWWQYVKAEPIG